MTHPSGKPVARRGLGVYRCGYDASVLLDPPPRADPRRRRDAAGDGGRCRRQCRRDDRAGASTAHDAGADLLVFPELNLTSYAIDDLHLQDALLDATEAALARGRRGEREAAAGAAGRRGAARATGGSTIARWRSRAGASSASCPRRFLPNYREYYEKRWFASGVGLTGLDDRRRRPDRAVRHRPDLRRRATCPTSSSTSRSARIIGRRPRPRPIGALAGALICCNLSASNIVDRQGARARRCCAPSQSARAVCRLCLFRRRAGREHHRSRLGRPGHDPRARRAARRIGALRATSPNCVVADVDCERLRQERMRIGTFNDTAARRRASRDALPPHRASTHQPDFADIGLTRDAPPLPVRAQHARRSSTRIATRRSTSRSRALRKRFAATKAEAARHRRLGRARFDPCADRRGQGDGPARPAARPTILGFTMPGFATGEGTKANAWALMHALGVTGDEIDIRPAARQMLDRHGPPVRRRRAGLRRDVRECAGGPAHRLSVPPRQPARRASSSAPAICPSWRSAGAPMASATR